MNDSFIINSAKDVWQQMNEYQSSVTQTELISMIMGWITIYYFFGCNNYA